jgi:hypothetical protein
MRRALLGEADRGLTLSECLEELAKARSHLKWIERVALAKRSLLDGHSVMKRSMVSANEIRFAMIEMQEFREEGLPDVKTINRFLRKAKRWDLKDTGAFSSQDIERSEAIWRGMNLAAKYPSLSQPETKQVAYQTRPKMNAVSAVKLRLSMKLSNFLQSCVSDIPGGERFFQKGWHPGEKKFLSFLASRMTLQLPRYLARMSAEAQRHQDFNAEMYLDTHPLSLGRNTSWLKKASIRQLPRRLRPVRWPKRFDL